MTVKVQQFLRLKQVLASTGLGRSTIYAAIAKGDFPEPVNIGLRAVAWPADVIANWQAERIEQSRRAASQEAAHAMR